MRKNYLLFFIVLSVFLSVNSQAEERTETLYYDLHIAGLEVPPLIFTEFRGDNIANYYVELTNVSDAPIDLSNFSLISGHTYTKMEGSTDSLARLGNRWGFVPLEGMLQPGESYVESSVWDVLSNPAHLPRHNVGIMLKSDRIYHQPEGNIQEFANLPEYQAFDKDSVDAYFPLLLMTGTVAYYLQYEYTDSLGNADSTLVDNVNFSIDDVTGFQNGKWGQGNYQTPVAGVTEAIDEYILVRKSTVKQGNMDWHLARGTDLATSEWLPIPEFNHKFNAFTTLGSHGDFEIDYTIVNPDKVSIDEATGILTVPWELARGESLSEQFTFGDGMGWAYTENSTDSVFTNVQDGDVFSMFAAGDEIKQLDLTLKVTPPASNIAIAYPNRILRGDMYSVIPRDGVVVPEVEAFTWRGLFAITQGLEMDSIYNIPFGTPVDTLLKYIYIPESGSYEMKYLNDETRSNLKKGDKLVVTSADGATTKEYLIEVLAYVPSSNAKLSLISWPDYDPNIYWEWASDTIPHFTPNSGAYTIRLMDGAKSIPALQFKPQSTNATVEVERAIDINGTLEQRTTKATVIAEDGITTNTYFVTFEIETVPVQPNPAEPFISELMAGQAFAYAIEIYNPGNVELDLSQYILLNGNANQNLSEALIEAGKKDMYRYLYAFGRRFKHDTDAEAYDAEPGILVPDNVTNTIVQAGDVFVAGTIPDGGWPGGRFAANANDSRTKLYNSSYPSNLDFSWYGWTFQHDDSGPGDSINNEFNTNPWGAKLHRYKNPAVIGFTGAGGRSYNSLFLLKIKNDSILNGTKNVFNADDYTIVDRFQKALDADKFYVSGFDLRKPHWQGWSIKRIAEVQKGVVERGEGIGDSLGMSAENSQYSIYNTRIRPEGISSTAIYDNIGAHTMNPITDYVSTVTSMYFEVTPGYEGNLTITGDIAALTVNSFFEMIDKAQVDQVLEIYNGAELVAGDALIADAYTLKVTAGNGKSETSYQLVNSPLSSDNLLLAVDGSGLTVSFSDDKGLVDGVAPGTTIKDLLANLTVPAGALLNVIDLNNNLVPLTVMNFDSMMVDVNASFNIQLEVLAQNGDAAVYSLGFGTTDSEAILLSSILNVDQKMRLVGEIPTGLSVVSLMNLVYANEGSTIGVVDNLGFDRDMGTLNYDDEILVTSADGTVTIAYKMKFVGTELAGKIMANVTFIVDDTQVKFPDGFMLKGSWNTMSGEYDTEWNDGAEHTALYDDGTHGDATSGDHIWTVTLSLAVDNGVNDWKWGFNDMSGNWVPKADIQFKIEDASEVVTTYVVGTNGIKSFGDNFRVYPNPASSELSIIGIDVQIVNLFSISGHQQEVDMIESNKIDVSRLNKGVYILKIIETNGKTSLAKFIKK